MEKTNWIMPKWMEKYRDYILNIGGNSIENLMNDTKTTFFSNHVRGQIIICVISQISLLEKLYEEGLLK